MEQQLTQIGLTDEEIERIGQMRYRKSNLRSLVIMMYSCLTLIIVVGVLLLAFYPNWIAAVLIMFPPLFVRTWQFDTREKKAGREYLQQIKNQLAFCPGVQPAG